jgi:hypothetical protein
MVVVIVAVEVTVVVVVPTVVTPSLETVTVFVPCPRAKRRLAETSTPAMTMADMTEIYLRGGFAVNYSELRHDESLMLINSFV